MNKKELLTLKNVLNNQYGFDLLYSLCLKSGSFERGLNRNANDKEIYMQLGKREFGQWLLDNILEADKDKYFEIVTEYKKEKNYE